MGEEEDYTDRLPPPLWLRPLPLWAMRAVAVIAFATVAVFVIWLLPWLISHK